MLVWPEAGAMRIAWKGVLVGIALRSGLSGL